MHLHSSPNQRLFFLAANQVVARMRRALSEYIPSTRMSIRVRVD